MSIQITQTDRQTDWSTIKVCVKNYATLTTVNYIKFALAFSDLAWLGREKENLHESNSFFLAPRSGPPHSLCLDNFENFGLTGTVMGLEDP